MPFSSILLLTRQGLDPSLCLGVSVHRVQTSSSSWGSSTSCLTDNISEYLLFFIRASFPVFLSKTTMPNILFPKLLPKKTKPRKPKNKRNEQIKDRKQTKQEEILSSWGFEGRVGGGLEDRQ